MTRLTRVTLNRIKQLPRVATVWEGDRRSVGGLIDEDPSLRQRGTEASDCILWIDSGQGAVRGLTIVPADSGYEPIVRTLLQAIESPQGGLNPARPKKIVVRDREIQFYLRGILQDLDIAIDYAPELPMIDHLFDALQHPGGISEAELPPRYSEALIDTAMDIWDLSPWNSLNEQQILAIELNAWDVDTLYVSMLGMAGVEYGLLMYRSLESLKQFRERVLQGQNSPKQMQEAFLEQDCLFLNFELYDDPTYSSQGQPVAWLANAPEAVQPDFGSIHPLEGLRSCLADEEAMTFLVAMEAVKRFFTKHHHRLERSPFPALQGNYRIPNPASANGSKTLNVTVKTLPDVTAELLAETEQALDDTDPPLSQFPAQFPVLRDDYVPEGSLIVLTQFQRDWLDRLQNASTVTYQASTRQLPPDLNTLPVVLIQTSRPKGKALIENLQQAQGVQSVCFNPGNDPFSGLGFELGLLQTGDDELHLFAEYETNSITDRQLLERWQAWQQDSSGFCGVVIAGGVTGNAKGNPGLKDIIGVFETHYRSSNDLNLPPLLLQYMADLDAD
jgi:hypothetical protein